MYKSEFKEQLKQFGKVKVKEPLAKHTTFRIGGPADFFITVDEVKKLPELIKFLQGEGLDYYLLGGGSNVLISDEGFKGVVIQLRDTGYGIRENTVEASAGSLLIQLARASIDAGLTGLEWAIGIPGTIGGAVRGNASCSGCDIKGIVEKVEVFRDGEILELKKEECGFDYKDTIFKHNNDVILRVWLKLKKGDPAQSAEMVKEYLQYRIEKQPKGPSAGCIFKNYVVAEEEKDKFKQIIKDEKILNTIEKFGKLPVGWLIDQVGMKGARVGGAEVSPMHGNFIVNKNNAAAEDVFELIEQIKEKVYNKFGVELEEEIQII